MVSESKLYYRVMRDMGYEPSNNVFQNMLDLFIRVSERAGLVAFDMLVCSLFFPSFNHPVRDAFFGRGFCAVPRGRAAGACRGGGRVGCPQHSSR